MDHHSRIERLEKSFWTWRLRQFGPFAGKTPAIDDDPRSLDALQGEWLVDAVSLCFYMARNIMADRHRAEDVCQQVSIRALRAANGFRGDSTVFHWFRTMLARHAISEAKKARRGPAHSLSADADVAPAVQVPNSDAFAELRSVVEAVIRTLPEKQRTALTLVLLEGIPAREAARISDINVSTFEANVFEGKKKLREILTRRGLVPATLPLERLFARPEIAMPSQELLDLLRRLPAPRRALPPPAAAAAVLAAFVGASLWIVSSPSVEKGTHVADSPDWPVVPPPPGPPGPPKDKVRVALSPKLPAYTIRFVPMLPNGFGFNGDEIHADLKGSDDTALKSIDGRAGVPMSIEWNQPGEPYAKLVLTSQSGAVVAMIGGSLTGSGRKIVRGVNDLGPIGLLPTGEVVARVVNDDGSPAVGWSARCNADGVALSATDVVRADADGKIIIPHVPAGDARLSVFLGTARTDVRKIYVAPKRSLNLGDIHVPKTFEETYRFLGRKATPLGNVHFQCIREQELFDDPSCITDAQGFVTLRRVVGEPLKVAFRGPNAEVQVDLDVRAESGSRSTAPIEVAVGGSWTLLDVQNDRNPEMVVDGVVVYIEGIMPRMLRRAGTAGSPGHYRTWFLGSDNEPFNDKTMYLVAAGRGFGAEEIADYDPATGVARLRSAADVKPETLHINVVGASDEPIASAAVWLQLSGIQIEDAEQSESDSSQFTLRCIGGASATLVVSAPGYATQCFEVSRGSLDQLDKTIKLARQSTITLSNPAGSPGPLQYCVTLLRELRENERCLPTRDLGVIWPGQNAVVAGLAAGEYRVAYFTTLGDFAHKTEVQRVKLAAGSSESVELVKPEPQTAHVQLTNPEIPFEQLELCVLGPDFPERYRFDIRPDGSCEAKGLVVGRSYYFMVSQKGMLQSEGLRPDLFEFAQRTASTGGAAPVLLATVRPGETIQLTGPFTSELGEIAAEACGAGRRLQIIPEQAAFTADMLREIPLDVPITRPIELFPGCCTVMLLENGVVLQSASVRVEAGGGTVNLTPWIRK